LAYLLIDYLVSYKSVTGNVESSIYKKLSYRRHSARRPLPETGLDFRRSQRGLAALKLTQLAPKAIVLCEITRDDCHWAVQGHSRSPNFGTDH